MLRNKRKLDKQEKRWGVSSEMRKSPLTVSKWQGKSRGLSSAKGGKEDGCSVQGTHEGTHRGKDLSPACCRSCEALPPCRCKTVTDQN